jgi:hypothetical protein
MISSLIISVCSSIFSERKPIFLKLMVALSGVVVLKWAECGIVHVVSQKTLPDHQCLPEQ